MKIATVLILCLSLCAVSTAGEASDHPNILFILADDMGWQDTSVAFAEERTKWNERYRTPALEQLAEQGVKFTQAYSCAVCSPTRVSLLTGQNAARHGVTQWTYLSGEHPSSDLSHPTLSHANWNWNGLQPEGTHLRNSVDGKLLPILLKQAGYRTMHFGKGHFGAAGTPGADPKSLGFDIRIGGRDAGGCGSYQGTKNFGAKANPDGPWRAWDLDHYFGRNIHLTEALTGEAKREIRNDGLSLRPLLEGRADVTFDRPLVWHFPNFWGPLQRPAPVAGPGMGPSSTIRRGAWKLIYYHVDQRFELFNLAEDLNELHNLADREPIRLRQLAGELSSILRIHRSPMPVVTRTGRQVPLPVEVLNR